MSSDDLASMMFPFKEGYVMTLWISEDPIELGLYVQWPRRRSHILPPLGHSLPHKFHWFLGGISGGILTIYIYFMLRGPGGPAFFSQWGPGLKLISGIGRQARNGLLFIGAIAIGPGKHSLFPLIIQTEPCPCWWSICFAPWDAVFTAIAITLCGSGLPSCHLASATQYNHSDLPASDS